MEEQLETTISLTGEAAPKMLTELNNRIEVAQREGKTDQNGALLPLPIALPEDQTRRGLVRQALANMAILEVKNLPQEQRPKETRLIIGTFRVAIQKLLRLTDCNFNEALVDPEVGVVRMLISRISLMLRYHGLMSAEDILASFDVMARPVEMAESGASRRTSLDSVPWNRDDDAPGWSPDKLKGRKEILNNRFKETGGQLFAVLNERLVTRTTKAKPYSVAHLFALQENYKTACDSVGITDQAERDNIYHALLLAACDTIMSEVLSAGDVREILNYVCGQLMEVKDIAGLIKLIKIFKESTESEMEEEDRSPTRLL